MIPIRERVTLANMRSHGGFVRQPVGIERGAMIAPGRDAVDENIAAAMAADMA
jgi:hypothetical protein